MGLIFTGLMLLALVLFMAPNVIALNRGNVLRNIAIWLAIFAGLGLAYKYLGPEGQGLISPPAIPSSAPPVQTPAVAPEEKQDKNFTPPKD